MGLFCAGGLVPSALGRAKNLCCALSLCKTTHSRNSRRISERGTAPARIVSRNKYCRRLCAQQVLCSLFYRGFRTVWVRSTFGEAPVCAAGFMLAGFTWVFGLFGGNKPTANLQNADSPLVLCDCFIRLLSHTSGRRCRLFAAAPDGCPLLQCRWPPAPQCAGHCGWWTAGGQSQ